MTTCMDSCANITYMMANLCAEVGELSGKIAKAVRHGDARLEGNHLIFSEGLTEEQANTLLNEMALEAGDVLWQLAGFCDAIGYDLEAIAQMNLKKLADRKKRGVIDGNGDFR
ncbi:MazG family pyrophosphatase [gut metagenome]|uniref:MazG family pyrophosphatase n=1 Tax=gut metagenome TaxID=749906 RepID=J9DAR1_9ZZZZ